MTKTVKQDGVEYAVTKKFNSATGAVEKVLTPTGTVTTPPPAKPAAAETPADAKPAKEAKPKKSRKPRVRKPRVRKAKKTPPTE